MRNSYSAQDDSTFFSGAWPSFARLDRRGGCPRVVCGVYS